LAIAETDIDNGSTDCFGRLIETTSADVINMSHYAKGMYILKIVQDNGVTATRRVVKQ
jgi:hypothetical protein